MIILRNREEMEKYYVKEVNTYVFKDNVVFLFDVKIMSHIRAWNINARNIISMDITANDIMACDIMAWNIKSRNINARVINYDEVCYAYYNIHCNSIKGRFQNAKHFVLDGELIVRGEENDK